MYRGLPVMVTRMVSLLLSSPSVSSHPLSCLIFSFSFGQEPSCCSVLVQHQAEWDLAPYLMDQRACCSFAIINDNKKVLTGSQHEAAMKWWKVILHLLSEKDKKRGEEMQEHVDLVSLSLFSPPRWVEFCQVRYGAVRIHAHFLSYFSILPNLL